MSRDRRAEGGRVGSILVGVGILGVLGVTFVTGVTVGRYWSARPGSLSASAPAPEPRTSGARGGEAVPVADRPVPTPPLTFYEELTAPLRPAPVVAKATGGPKAPPGADRASPERAPMAPPPVRPDSAPSATPSATEVRTPGSARFTVQVGAFRERAAAESLRARLAREGQQAYVVEVGGRARYRVRVGAFESSQAARRVADRLGADHRLRPFVTQP